MDGECINVKRLTLLFTLVLCFGGYSPSSGSRDSDLDMTGHRLLNLADPTDPQHAATKAYADSILIGGVTSFPAHTYFGNNTGTTGTPAPHIIDYSELSGTPTIPSNTLHYVTTQTESGLSNEFNLGA